ncbi:hypothetical protein C0992_006773 [Termitomyces sp. T32_za158]|nr:hypothetical protein C0992_006773 [Termitomyces sp. T32_za158]
MARPRIHDIVRRLRDLAQKDTRSTASWVQIAVIRREPDQGSFQRGLEIIDEIVRRQNLSHLNALPLFDDPWRDYLDVHPVPGSGYSPVLIKPKKYVCTF